MTFTPSHMAVIIGSFLHKNPKFDIHSSLTHVPQTSVQLTPQKERLWELVNFIKKRHK